jgi:hypothetical protein
VKEDKRRDYNKIATHFGALAVRYVRFIGSFVNPRAEV